MFDRLEAHHEIKDVVTVNGYSLRGPTAEFEVASLITAGSVLYRFRIHINTHDMFGCLGKKIATVPLATGNVQDTLISDKVRGIKIAVPMLVGNLRPVQVGHITLACELHRSYLISG
jgi:hypothetical protein